jgi:type II secretory pathway pseudopilin PulG
VTSHGKPTLNRLRRKARSAGFTLVEAMIATAVVALGFTATVSLLTVTRVNNDLEQERARAHQIVLEEMERVRLELFTRISPGRETTVWDNGTPDDDTDDTVGTLTVLMRDINGVALTGPPVTWGRIEVEITLSWNPRGRLKTKTMRETLMTYVTP